MAADLSRKFSPPLLPDSLPVLLRAKPARERTGRAKSLENLGGTPQKAIQNPLPQPLSQRLEPRGRILLAGARHAQAHHLASLDKAAARLSTQVFLVHEAPLHMQSLEQIHKLPATTATKSGDLMRRASAFVSLTHDPFDPFLLAAAKDGCPLVLADMPDLRTTWEGAALFLSLDQTSALANALRRLLEDPEYRQRLALAALRRAQTLIRPKPLTPLV